LGTTATFANSLVSTSPISGSTLSVSPTSVTVTGQLPLLADANEISVTDPNGVRVDDGTIMVNDVSATVGVRPLTESGFYTVSYILFAEADAPLEGSYRFKYRAQSLQRIQLLNQLSHILQPAAVGEQMYLSFFFLFLQLV
jgi:methionine-rich copper-binding protein CopC